VKYTFFPPWLDSPQKQNKMERHCRVNCNPRQLRQYSYRLENICLNRLAEV